MPKTQLSFFGFSYQKGQKKEYVASFIGLSHKTHGEVSGAAVTPLYK